MFVSYHERNVVLKEMGFRSYQEYLDSELWSIIRKNILSRDAHFCRGKLCNSRSTLVHHLSYNKPTLLGEAPFALITLCKDCHRKVEWNGSTKRTLKESQKATLELVIGTVLEKGVSNPRVGRWFRNQLQMNVPIRKAILEEINNVSLSSL
jgi:hypothetical protein